MNHIIILPRVLVRVNKKAELRIAIRVTQNMSHKGDCDEKGETKRMTRGTSGLRPPLKDVQDCEPICRCNRCFGEMYSGELSCSWGTRRVCVDCFKAVTVAWLEEAPQEVACALGVENRVL